MSGVLDEVDTSGWSVDEELFVDASTAGALTNVKPSATTDIVEKVGVVCYSHATEGVIQVYNAGAAVHANRGGGSLHAVASDTEAGFLPQSKMDATSAPTVNDDSGQGFQVGSRWINVTLDKEYVCLDATASAAVWTETTAGAAGGGQTDTVAGSNGITNTGDNVDAVLAPTYGSSANTICQGNDSRLNGPSSDIATATAQHSTTSTTDILANGMTLTPASGTYMVWFTGTYDNSVKGNDVICSIYAGGSRENASESVYAPGGNNYKAGFACVARVTVNGSQAIEGKFKAGGATASVYARTLSILKVA
jgi:hypothetical protein